MATERPDAALRWCETGSLTATPFVLFLARELLRFAHRDFGRIESLLTELVAKHAARPLEGRDLPIGAEDSETS